MLCSYMQWTQWTYIHGGTLSDAPNTVVVVVISPRIIRMDAWLYDTRHKQRKPCAFFVCRVTMDYEKKTLKNVGVDKNTTRLPSAGPQSPTSKCIRSLIDCDRAVVCKGHHPAFASSAFRCRREACLAVCARDIISDTQYFTHHSFKNKRTKQTLVLRYLPPLLLLLLLLLSFSAAFSSPGSSIILSLV